VRYFLVGRWGGIGLRKGDWSCPARAEEGIVVVTAVWAMGGGGGATGRGGFGVAGLVAGGVLASISRASMRMRPVGAGGVLLGVSGIGVSESVAVGALDVAVSLTRFLDLNISKM